MGKYDNLSPEEVNIPLKNHPITVSHVVVSGNGHHEFPLIPAGKFGELVTKNNEYDSAEEVETLVANIDVDIWRIVEIPPDQMTTAESTDDKALNEAMAERARRRLSRNQLSRSWLMELPRLFLI